MATDTPCMTLRCAPSSKMTPLVGEPAGELRGNGLFGKGLGVGEDLGADALAGRPLHLVSQR